MILMYKHINLINKVSLVMVMITLKEKQALHYKIKKLKKKPLLCEKCKKNKATELSNISQKYLDDINDWWWLCGSCHTKYDNIYERNLKKWKQDNSFKGKTFKELFGKKKAEEISNKLRKKKLGIKWTEEQKESIRGIKKPYLSKRNKKNKGKTFEEIYGKKKAEQIKEKMKITTKNQKRNKKGHFKK